MTEYLPILIVGAIIGVFTTLFLVAWAILKRHKEDMTDRERHMSDREIITRLLRYAKPYWKSFVAVGIIMLFSIAYEVASPLLMGAIQGLVKQENFQLSRLYSTVAVYAGILIAHRISTIESMDKILFIDDGALAGIGTHQALYETNAEYRKMVDLQRLEEEGGEHNA